MGSPPLPLLLLLLHFLLLLEWCVGGDGVSHSETVTVCQSSTCLRHSLHTETKGMTSEKTVMIYLRSLCFPISSSSSSSSSVCSKKTLEYIFLIEDLFRLCDYHILVDDYSNIFLNDSDDFYDEMMDEIDNIDNEVDVASSSIRQLADELHSRLNYVFHEMFHDNLAVIFIDTDPFSSKPSFISHYNSIHDHPLFVSLHLDDHSPWQESQYKQKKKQGLYQEVTIPLRTNYFEKFRNFVTYVPAFAPKFSIHASESTSQLLASHRPVFCSYVETVQGRYGFEWRHDRNIHNDIIASCLFLSSSSDLTGVLSEEEYLETLRSSSFVLCPLGDDVREQRVHEALEAGAIPIILRMPMDHRDQDFMTVWRDYPGPLFSTWEEANNYLENVASNENGMDTMDIIQKALQIWYADYRTVVQEMVKIKVDEAFRNRFK